MKVLIILIFLILSCSSFITQEEKVNPDEKSLFDGCMETFKDEEKCNEFAKSQIEKLKKEEEEKLTTKLDPEVERNLKIRDDLKDKLQNRNELFVKNYIGEPDKKYNDSSGNTHFIYYRPIARYSKQHDPDIEIDVIFKRFRVSRVNHTPPPTTPSGFDLFTNKYKNKK